MENFIVYILLPTWLMRVYAQLKWRGRDPVDFKEFGMYIDIYGNGTYGMWTLYNLIRILRMSKNCKDQPSLSILNYEITVMFGCFSAVNVLFISIIILILIPLLTYQGVVQRRQRTERQRRTKKLLKIICEQSYTPSRFKEN
mmetsp:Transcript_6159/g.9921  ORF Transcript_6159/g.9921 Transcript_6159/m.9921 type:complete len:142 (+) Transcript_6159:701-1126(+)